MYYYLNVHFQGQRDQEDEERSGLVICRQNGGQHSRIIYKQ